MAFYRKIFPCRWRQYKIFILLILCTIYIFWVMTGSTLLLCGEPSFPTEMKNFEWKAFNRSVTANNISQIVPIATKLFKDLVPFLTKPPFVPLNTSCHPPPMKLSPKHKCQKLDKPRKVGVLIQFSYEVDTLEIHLNELNDVVDKFFLIESVKPHGPYVTHKPLFWDSLKDDERFAAFAPKVVHFVLDDAHLQSVKISQGKFGKENLQEKLRWLKFLEWNNATGFFSNSDILGFGDVDEVPYRDNIYYLKNCEFDHDPIDIGISFPLGRIDSVRTSDFPVKDHPFTLGDPTYWTLGKAISHHNSTGKIPSRNRGRSTGYLLGGMHLSTYPYPPYQIAKHLTVSEYTLARLKQVIRAGFYYAQGDINSAEEFLAPTKLQLPKRVMNVSDFRRSYEDANDTARVPWLYSCNPDRYPAYQLKHDKRLD